MLTNDYLQLARTVTRLCLTVMKYSTAGHVSHMLFILLTG
jgi:hypothetical protein